MSDNLHLKHSLQNPWTHLSYLQIMIVFESELYGKTWIVNQITMDCPIGSEMFRVFNFPNQSIEKNEKEVIKPFPFATLRFWVCWLPQPLGRNTSLGAAWGCFMACKAAEQHRIASVRLEDWCRKHNKSSGNHWFSKVPMAMPILSFKWLHTPFPSPSARHFEV